jgi:uncharacterized protein YecE (DUF72 family)
MNYIHIGLSGFSYPTWFQTFYPKNVRREGLLTFYAQHFNTVEINSSFYHIPRERSVANWYKAVPEHFIFSVKASRLLTHNPEFEFEKETIDRFFKSLSSLTNSPIKHIVLFQLPYSLEKNLFQLTKLLESLPQTFRYAFEFRHQTWCERDVYELLQKYNSAIVLSDSPKKINGERIWPYMDIQTADFCYIRFHGSQELYASSYTDEELEYYAKLIRSKVNSGISVYAYFNNDVKGQAIENARRLKVRLSL